MCTEEFKCEECEKEFKNSNLLELHKRKHEKFECEECDSNPVIGNININL